MTRRADRDRAFTASKENEQMSIVKAPGKRLGLFAALAAIALLAAAPAAQAAVPKWKVDSLSSTTAAPGETFEYYVQLTNVGDGPTDGTEFDLTGTFPAGLKPRGGFITLVNDYRELKTIACTAGDGSTLPSATDPTHVRCAVTAVLPDAQEFQNGSMNPYVARLRVEAQPAVSGTLTAAFEVSGGGAPAASTVDPLRVTAAAPFFGIDAFDAQIRDAAGRPFLAAARHPADITVPLDLNTHTVDVAPGIAARGGAFPVEPPRDIVADLPPGLIGSPASLAQCSSLRLAEVTTATQCPSAAQVGTVELRFNDPLLPPSVGPLPLYNAVPPPGVAARFGFNVAGTVVTLDARLRQDGSYALGVGSTNISEGVSLAGVINTFWGVPGDEAHRSERACPYGTTAEKNYPPSFGGPNCPGGSPDVAFLRMPTSCTGQPLAWSIHTDSWFDPGAFDSTGYPDLSDPAWHSRTIQSHDLPGYPYLPEDWGAPNALSGCDEVPVEGKLSARPTALEAETSSGLSVHIEVPNPGLKGPNGTASSDIEAIKVSLPEGVTVNPSQASGLGVCTEAQYESSRLEFHSDGAHGCPSDSKIGTLEVHTPLIEETIPGTVYIAKPYDNPEGSLLALYIVLAEPQRGVLIKLPAKVETDGTSGRIVTTVSGMPQLPFSSIDMKLREGARAPLVTPPTCGTYTTETQFTGWSDPAHPITSDSSFQITRGIGGSACPNGAPGFSPGFTAGTINNAAGAYSPFYMRLTRADGEQDLTKFSSVLPEGVVGRLAGLTQCSDAALAAAAARSGAEEKANPSCPASSEIGRTLVGAGVGSVLTRVPGSLYLAGPYHGAPLSVAAITPAVAGPFDVGTVVVREALSLDPRTAVVRVDGAASDPIPHILKGIPLKVRDIRVYVDRSQFTLNATSCAPEATNATIFGSGLNVFSSTDDSPVDLSARYQAASCGALGFKPRLKVRLKGGTRRGRFPALHAVYAPRPGDTNLSRLALLFPSSEFIEQGHFRTICTRVQFAAGAGFGSQCPKGSIYGHIEVWTPLLSEPLKGPVYLRSSNHNLPDAVFALHGLVDIEIATRIDSTHGRLRAIVSNSPDAPVSRAVVRMQGGAKGLFVNSRNLCVKQKRNRARVIAGGQNGRKNLAKPLMRALACGKHRVKRHGRHHRSARVAKR